MQKPKRPSRDTDLQRVRDVRNSADQVLVVCGALTTERDYLTGFRKHFKHPNLSVKVTRKPGSPLQIVQHVVDRLTVASWTLGKEITRLPSYRRNRFVRRGRFASTPRMAPDICLDAFRTDQEATAEQEPHGARAS